jgi:hypothetical protein
MKARTIGYIFINRFWEGVGFLKNHPDAFSQVGDIHIGAIDIHAVEQQRTFQSSTFNQVVEPIQAAQQGGLSTAGWPNEGRHLILDDFNIEVEESLAVSIKEVYLIQGELDRLRAGVVVGGLSMAILHGVP